MMTFGKLGILHVIILITGTSFQRVIGDATCPGGLGVEKVVFCSGKIYYELLQERKEQGMTDKAAIIRIEQVKVRK